MWDQMTTKGKVGVAVVAALAIGAAGFWSGQGLRRDEPIKISSVATDVNRTATSALEEIVVEVSGAVVTPGVYKLPSGSRVMDALKAAGGPTSSADTSGLNLAQRVSDGLKIDVPVFGSSVPSVPETGQSGGMVSLNSGSQEDLETLPGIGPAMSHAIIEYRVQHGGFRAVEELMKVPGIGEKTFDQIRDRVTL